MAGKRLGRGLTPQGSAAVRQPSPYHYLEFFDTAGSFDNEESLISFDDDAGDGDTSAKVPHSSIVPFVTSLTPSSKNPTLPLQPRIPWVKTNHPIPLMLAQNQFLESQFPKTFSMKVLIFFQEV
jgi:hypothetical protein